ncbi:unnamed protein product, partial [Ectocarpus sp. 12 AP-2014]
ILFEETQTPPRTPTTRTPNNNIPKQAGFVVYATLCWPALMLVALGAALIEIKAACKRFMLARRQSRCMSDECSPDRGPTTPFDLEGGDTIRSSGSSPAVVTIVAVVLVDELPGAIMPALTTTWWPTPLVVQ